MQPTPTTLSSEEIKGFNDDGYVVVRGAFARDDALAMQREWWAELAEVEGVLRDDRSTWRRVLRDLRRAKLSPGQTAIGTARVRGVIDDLLGSRISWPPRNWGRVLTTFSQPGEWDVPTELWHWDSPCAWHHETMNGLFVLAFVGSVAPGSAGTLIISGSHRLLRRQEAVLAQQGWRGDARARRELFYRSDPWLMALTGNAASPADRVAAFIHAGAEVEGVPVRVVELTGEPGDMVFCHPTIVHCASPNHGEQPRFMRIAQLITPEVQAFRGGSAP